jgi:hypothetical protein
MLGAKKYSPPFIFTRLAIVNFTVPVLGQVCAAGLMSIKVLS